MNEVKAHDPTHAKYEDPEGRCIMCMATWLDGEANRLQKELSAALLQNDALKRLEAVVRYEHEGSCKSPSCGICLELQRPALKRERPQQNCIDCGKPVASGNICLPCVRVRYPSGGEPMFCGTVGCMKAAGHSGLCG